MPAPLRGDPLELCCLPRLVSPALVSLRAEHVSVRTAVSRGSAAGDGWFVIGTVTIRTGIASVQAVVYCSDVGAAVGATSTRTETRREVAELVEQVGAAR